MYTILCWKDFRRIYHSGRIESGNEENMHELLPKHITLDDIVASINYVMHLDYAYGNVDDINQLG